MRVRRIVLIALFAVAAATARPPAGGAAAAGGACPARLPATVASTRPGAGGRLVPPGVRSLLLCAYHGLNPPGESGRLERERIVDSPAALAWLVSNFDALPPAPRLTSCPMDDGTADLAVFSYSGSPLNPVTVGLTGCRIVTNGRVTRTASLAPGPTLLTRLGALIG
jgi:hypothetical protein